MVYGIRVGAISPSQSNSHGVVDAPRWTIIRVGHHRFPWLGFGHFGSAVTESGACAWDTYPRYRTQPLNIRMANVLLETVGTDLTVPNVSHVNSNLNPIAKVNAGHTWLGENFMV